MPKITHTPGPWISIKTEQVDSSDPYRFAIICAADPIGTKANDIASIPYRASEGRTAANARLIAASPDLLKLADRLFSFYELHKAARGGQLGREFEELRAKIMGAPSA